MLKRFFAYYKPHKLMFTLDMLAAFTVSMIGIFYPIVTRTMLNEYIPNKEYQNIIIFGCILLGLYLVKMALNYFVTYYGHLVGVGMQADMRRDVFTHLQKLPMSVLLRCTEQSLRRY